jgi:hypothetical protein
MGIVDFSLPRSVERTVAKAHRIENGVLFEILRLLVLPGPLLACVGSTQLGRHLESKRVLALRDQSRWSISEELEAKLAYLDIERDRRIACLDGQIISLQLLAG